MSTSQNTPVYARLLSIVAGIGLFLSILLSCFMICIQPASVWTISSLTSDEASSEYTKAQLVETAMVVRDYTTGSIGRDALDKQMEHLIDIAFENAGGLETHLPRINFQGERFILSDAAIDHLDDVRSVLQAASTAFTIIGTITIVAFVALIILSVRTHNEGIRRICATSMKVSSLTLLVFMGIVTLWALISFNSLFTMLHMLFFEEGTWTFAPDSLLICMYPTAFWVGMFVLWLAITVVLCTVIILFARWITHSGHSEDKAHPIKAS